MFEKATDATVFTFELMNKKFVEIWSTFVAIVAGLFLALFVIYIVVSLVLPEKKAKKTNLVQLSLSVGMIISGVLVVIFGLIFSLTNSFTIPFFNTTTKIVPLIGFYVLLCGTLVAGICGIVSSTGSKKRKRK